MSQKKCYTCNQEVTMSEYFSCRHPACPETYDSRVIDKKLIFEIRTRSDYEAYARVYLDRVNNSIIISEETPDGKVLGNYVNEKL